MSQNPKWKHLITIDGKTMWVPSDWNGEGIAPDVEFGTWSPDYLNPPPDLEQIRADQASVEWLIHELNMDNTSGAYFRHYTVEPANRRILGLAPGHGFVEWDEEKIDTIKRTPLRDMIRRLMDDDFS